MLTVIWAAVYVLGTFVLLAVLPVQSNGIPTRNVLFTVASARGNGGLVSGVVTPLDADGPPAAKPTLTFNIRVGRLEVFPSTSPPAP